MSRGIINTSCLLTTLICYNDIPRASLRKLVNCPNHFRKHFDATIIISLPFRKIKCKMRIKETFFLSPFSIKL